MTHTVVSSTQRKSFTYNYLIILKLRSIPNIQSIISIVSDIDETVFWAPDFIITVPVFTSV